MMAAIAAIAEHVAHEALIDLQYIDRQALEVGQAGIAGAEVINGDTHAHRLEFAQGGAGRGDVMGEHALGDLQLQQASSLLKFAAMITPTASGSSGRARLLPV